MTELVWKLSKATPSTRKVLRRKTMLNIEGLRLALKVTEKAAQQGNWNQLSWLKKNYECGTAGCFAGNYALAMGCKPYFEGKDDFATAFIVTPEGKCQSVSSYVTDELGLTGYQAAELFSVNNTLEDLRFYVDKFIDLAEAKLEAEALRTGRWSMGIRRVSSLREGDRTGVCNC